MKTQEQQHYDRIARAIEYLGRNYRSQPSLEDVARHIHLSPYHFQRLFSEWAGVSPKKFLQYISVSYAKQLLHAEQTTLFSTAHKTGLSGTGRLHDLFVSIEGMTPGEFKNGGQQLSINYSFTAVPFGKVLIASTSKGICHLAFIGEEKSALAELQQQFPAAGFHQRTDTFQQEALKIINRDRTQLDRLKLHLRGTPFQLKVWEALLKIPMGQLSTYGKLANTIHQPKASRAVGSAIGKNPVAFLIPCHRVIQSSGLIGGYRWGATRKTAMIGWEAVQAEAGR